MFVRHVRTDSLGSLYRGHVAPQVYLLARVCLCSLTACVCFGLIAASYVHIPQSHWDLHGFVYIEPIFNPLFSKLTLFLLSPLTTILVCVLRFRFALSIFPHFYQCCVLSCVFLSRFLSLSHTQSFLIYCSLSIYLDCRKYVFKVYFLQLTYR